jgi:hypothetical protein
MLVRVWRNETLVHCANIWCKLSMAISLKIEIEIYYLAILFLRTY